MLAPAQITDVRPPAVAGLFYPAAPDELGNAVDHLLAAVPPASTFQLPKALIVPHAGYIYSGVTAAFAYAPLARHADCIKRIILLGPCHRVAVRGLAIPTVSAFATPLGTVPLDDELLARISSFPQIVRSDAAHAQEHALEVQLPFLQRVLPHFILTPLAIGAATPYEVAEIIEQMWNVPDTLFVISSDLSHFHAYEEAQRRDRLSVNDILHLHGLTDHEQACGATPINGLLEVARRRGLIPQLLDLRNSGDTAGDKQRVVGYASIAFLESDHA